jgi:hypothetical protein
MITARTTVTGHTVSDLVKRARQQAAPLLGIDPAEVVVDEDWTAHPRVMASDGSVCLWEADITCHAPEDDQ